MAGRFVAGADEVQQLPAMMLPEVALVGRSNVGKSSWAGVIMGQPKLVRVSRTPGRTRQLLLFVCDERLAVVDLPGYGYASLSRSERCRLQEAVRDYVAQRSELRGVVQFLDARRAKVTDEDRETAAWVLAQRRQLLVAVTKTDLIGKHERRQRVRAIEDDLGIPAGAAVLCSARTGEGRSELLARLWELVG